MSRLASLLVALAAAAALLVTTACGERTEPVGPSASVFPVTVTGADDRPVTLAAPARRIALIDPALVHLLQGLGAGAWLVGTPVQADGDLRPAQLAELDPDLVVASSATDGRTLSQAAAAAGAPIYVAHGSSIREVERSITQLGMLTAMPVAARALVRDVEQRRRGVERRVRGRPRASVFVDLGFFTTASDQTLVGDLVRAAGGVNIAARLADGGPIDLADLRRADPDVYVATVESGQSLEELRADPRTRKLTSVRRGRLVLVHRADLEPGPGIGRVLEQLARALHPDAFR